MPTLLSHLSDMPEDFRQELLDYISSSIVKSSERHTAYGLQQGFNALNVRHPNLHISVSCFMEAMCICGYEATPLPNKDDWYFFAKRI